MSQGKCIGNCCVVFTYGRLTHIQLANLAAESRDEAFIKDMLVPLSGTQADERYRRLVPLEMQQQIFHDYHADPANADLSFTCRHWNEETRLCGAYAQRPRMCRDYPYGRKCLHECGFTCCRRYPLNPRGKRNLAYLTYIAARITYQDHDLGVA